MSSHHVGEEVYVSVPETGDATPLRVVVLQYEYGTGYVVESLTDDRMFFGWVQEIYDDKGNELS